MRHPSFLRAACAALALAACSSEVTSFPPQPDSAAEPDASVEMDSTVAPDSGGAPDARPQDGASDASADRPRDAGADVRDAARDVPPPDVPDFEDGGITGPTFDYALTRFVIDGNAVGAAPNPSTHAEGVAGFNLDGRFTGSAPRDPADCQHGDFFSTLDPDQNMGTCAAGTARGGAGCTGGVDNQLPEIADTVMGFGADVRTTINTLTATGQTAILVRVSGVDGTPGPTLDDEQVTVRVYTVARPMFADCSRIGTPGQAYAVDDASLTVPGDLARARYRFNARIVRGRLVTTPTGSMTVPDFALDIPLIGGEALPLPIYGTRLRADLTPDAAMRGNLGGAAPLRELATALAASLPAGVPAGVVNAVLQGFVDVQDPAGDPAGCTNPNGSIGMGMGFSAVRAVVRDATVRGPQAGMCGS